MVDASCEAGIRGEAAEGAFAEGAGRVAQLLGLGSRFICGDVKGGAAVDATAVDMTRTSSQDSSMYI